MSTAGRLAGACAAVVLAFLAAPAAAQPSEHAVKAAFLYRFTAYIEWPAPSRSDAPFVIGIVGADDVAAELSAILPGRSITGRATQVRVLRESDSLQGIQMLFIGKRVANPRALVAAAHQQGTLTVSETTLESGAAITFVVVESRVTFDVSLDAAEKSGHRISSRMLSVARRVTQKGGL